MRPNYEQIMNWMEEYFKAYNAYAQNPETVERMADYFTPDVHFVPYVSAFGGPENAVTSRDEFFKMFIGHPINYERFEVEDIVVDEEKMAAVALLNVALFDSATDKMLLRKHYLVRYQLVLDEKNMLKIKTILFFWEAMPPELDALYAIETSAGAPG